MRRSTAITTSVLLLALAAPAAASEPAVLTLDDAWARALVDSDDLEALRAGVTRAQAGQRRALGALLPVIAATGTYRLNDEEVSIGDRVVSRQHNFSGNLSLSLGLFDGRAIPAYGIARDRVGVAGLQLDEARQTVLLLVAESYYAALGAEQLARVAEQALTARRQHLAAAEARLAAGHAVRLDIERAQAAIHRAERDVIDTRSQVEAARDGVAMAIGATPPLVGALAPPVVSAPEPADPPPLGEEEALARAHAQRLDLRALEQSLELADAARTMTWWAFAPRLSLVGSIDFSEETLSRPNSVSSSLTIQLSWTLYDGGMRYAQLDEDAAAIREARAAVRRQTRQVAAEVRDAIRALERGAAALTASRAERDAARRALDAAEVGFRLGNATGLDVIDAQLALEQAEVSLIRENLSLDVARLVLQRVIGALRPPGTGDSG